MSKTEEINELLKKLPLAPTGVERWVQECVVENAYIIFDSNQQKAVCTRCGKQFSMKHIAGATHNHETYCPKCHSAATYKASHYGRKRLTEYFRVLILTHRGKTVYGTLFDVTAEFEPFGRPVLNKWLSALYVFKENEQHYYKHHPQWFTYSERWTEVQRMNLPNPASGIGYPSKYEKTVMYEDNLENVFTKSCLKYHYDPDFFAAYITSPRRMIRYISQCLKYPAIELLRKAGYKKVVEGRISGYGTMSAINVRGKNLKSILRLPKRWQKKVKEMNMSLDQLYEFQRLDEASKAVADHEFLRTCSMGAWYRDDIEKFVSYGKAVLFVNKQDSFISYYRDYLEAAQAIGEDMNSKHVLFPKDLRTEHDRVTAMRTIQQDQKAAKAMDEAVKKIKQNFPEYRSGAFLIRAAESQLELNKESTALTHCVRTYGEKMAKGKTMIFFIRWIDEPDVPFYTLELNYEKRMVQCRGERNCAMTEEVKSFVDEWLEVIQKRPKKKKEAA